MQIIDKVTDFLEGKSFAQGEHLVFVHVIDVCSCQKKFLARPLTEGPTCPHGLERNAGSAVVCNHCCDLAGTLVAESALVETQTPVSNDEVSINIFSVEETCTHGIIAAFLVISLYSRATSNGNGPAIK